MQSTRAQSHKSVMAQIYPTLPIFSEGGNVYRSVNISETVISLHGWREYD